MKYNELLHGTLLVSTDRQTAWIVCHTVKDGLHSVCILNNTLTVPTGIHPASMNEVQQDIIYLPDIIKKLDK